MVQVHLCDESKKCIKQATCVFVSKSRSEELKLGFLSKMAKKASTK